jgi:hypothetical protein
VVVSDKGAGFLAYASVLERIMQELNKDHNLAPIIIAGIRELRKFPEYRDATILFLDEIAVTGDSHFDQLLKKEMTELENLLLEVSND